MERNIPNLAGYWFDHATKAVKHRSDAIIPEKREEYSQLACSPSLHVSRTDSGKFQSLIN